MKRFNKIFGDYTLFQKDPGQHACTLEFCGVCPVCESYIGYGRGALDGITRGPCVATRPIGGSIKATPCMYLSRNGPTTENKSVHSLEAQAGRDMLHNNKEWKVKVARLEDKGEF